VEVQLVDCEETRLLGRTDAAGGLNVSRDSLARGGVLLFCRQGFFCGALNVSEPRFLEFREHYIELAPFSVL
jgi:hypothetical protein